MKKFFTKMYERLPKHKIMMSSRNQKLPHMVYEMGSLNEVN